MFQVKPWIKMPKWKPFLKYNFPRNTSVYVFITEIIWRNNWWSIIDGLEGLGQGLGYWVGSNINEITEIFFSPANYKKKPSQN